MERTPDELNVAEGSTVSLDALYELADFDSESLGQLRHEGLTMLQVEKQLRMRHVLEHLDEGQASLLFEKFVARRTYSAIGRDLGVSHVAVLKRVRTATQNFKRAFGEHWLCPLDPEDLTSGTSVLDLADGT